MSRAQASLEAFEESLRIAESMRGSGASVQLDCLSRSLLNVGLVMRERDGDGDRERYHLSVGPAHIPVLEVCLSAH